MPEIPFDPRWRNLKASWWVRHQFWLDGFFGLITEGRQRIGKTSYCSQVVAEALGTPEINKDVIIARPDYAEAKGWIVFPPKEFLDRVLETYEKKPVLLWDDAGFWLFALDWYEPFVKTVAKYINLIGRQFAALLFTTPNKKLISSKVLEAIPDIYICRLTEIGKDKPKYKRRVAKAYERWDYPDGKRGGVHTRWTDYFNAILPDSFFNWYKPISDRYLEIGKRLLRKEVEVMAKKTAKKEAKEEKEELMESVHKVVGDPKRFKEIDEVIATFSS